MWSLITMSTEGRTQFGFLLEVEGRKRGAKVARVLSQTNMKQVWNAIMLIMISVHRSRCDD